MDPTAASEPVVPSWNPFRKWNPFWIGAAGMALVLLVGAAAGLLVWTPYPTTQTVERTFTMGVDFTTVRKIMVRTDATKEIVTMTGDSEFIDQHWNAVGGGLDNLDLRDLKWKLELHGTLLLRTRDPYIGEHEIELNQQVKIDPDSIFSDVELERPTAKLLQYEMTVWFERAEDDKTRVRQRLKQEVVTEAPRLARFIADRRVYQSAESALVNQQQAIERIVEENRDRRWLLLP